MENKKMTVEELEAMVETYLALKVKQEELNAQLEEMKAKLTEVAENTEDGKVLVGVHKITLTEQVRMSISYKQFAETHPRLAKKFATETKYKVLRVK